MPQTDEICTAFQDKAMHKEDVPISEKILIVFFKEFHFNSKIKSLFCSMNRGEKHERIPP